MKLSEEDRTIRIRWLQYFCDFLNLTITDIPEDVSTLFTPDVTDSELLVPKDSAGRVLSRMVSGLYRVTKRSLPTRQALMDLRQELISTLNQKEGLRRIRLSSQETSLIEGIVNGRYAFIVDAPDFQTHARIAFCETLDGLNLKRAIGSCADPKCERWFVKLSRRKPGKVIYCNDKCGGRVRTRRSRKKLRQKEK